MTPDTFMSISQQSKPESSPNKLGWKEAFDPRPTWVTSALQLDCFQLRFLWVASLQAKSEAASAGFTRGFKNRKVVLRRTRKALGCGDGARSRPCFCDIAWHSLRLHVFQLNVRRRYGPVISHNYRCLPELYAEATAGHIPSDHSWVWRFKEDYENEMW